MMTGFNSLFDLTREGMLFGGNGTIRAFLPPSGPFRCPRGLTPTP